MAFVSDKEKDLPSYLFAAFQTKKTGLEARGVDVDPENGYMPLYESILEQE